MRMTLGIVGMMEHTVETTERLATPLVHWSGLAVMLKMRVHPLVRYAQRHRTQTLLADLSALIVRWALTHQSICQWDPVSIARQGLMRPHEVTLFDP